MVNVYSEGRRRPEKAASYDTKYERQIHKRISCWRERRLLQSILKRTGRQRRLLDVPCGAGRLSGVLSSFADEVFEVDYSSAMLKLCRHNAKSYRPLTAVASALKLPFPGAAFDVVVSIRLSHHLPERQERLEHLGELCRVSSRFVLCTFFGEETLKNRLRTLSRKLGGRKRPKYTLSRREVEHAARAWRFQLVKCWQLSRLFSGHYFALLEKMP